MRYFAYGANMDPVHMAEQCPGARPIGPAVLPDHRFRIARAGYGTGEPERGAAVRGFLWELGPADVAALDVFEGVPEDLYYRGFCEVTLPGGETTRAMLYRATDPAPGIPAPGYLERILEVAESLGFPESYLEELRALFVPR